MIKNIFIFLILFFFNSICYSQKDKKIENEIFDLVIESNSLLTETNFEQSLIKAKLALQMAIEIKNDTLISYAYNSIGNDFDQLADYEKSIFYFKKGAQYAEKSNNRNLIRSIYNNIANVYCFEKKDFKNGISYFKKALKLTLPTDKIIPFEVIQANIAWAYFDFGKFNEGYQYLKYINEKSTELGEKYGEKEDFLILNLLNGMYYANKNENNKAILYFEKGIKLSEGLDVANKVFLYEEYAKFLEKSGNYKKAYEIHLIFYRLNEEIYATKKMQAANLSGLDLQLDEYRREIKKIEQKNLIQSERLKNSKKVTILFIVGFAVLLLLLYFLYKNYAIKRDSYADLEQVNKELKFAKEQAEEASMLKTQFVSTITHELRTPLYGVVGITDMLIAENKNSLNDSHLDSLKFSANYLLSLVNDVLQISKIDESEIILEKNNFNIYKKISIIKTTLKYIADNNNVVLISDIDPKIPSKLNGDSHKLAQILMNLISNALKFTKNGTVTIKLRLEKFENNKCFIEFKIIDTGIGIAPENQSKIFDQFTQIKQKNSDYQGTGLGLSIVKKLVKLFQSQIHLESVEGVGSTFTFRIGFDSYIENQEANTTLELNTDTTKNKILKILIVDDNKINQLVTQKLIEQKKYICEIVDSGNDAIEILKTQKFDVILMDINMPILNGYETTKILRKQNILIPIIALTASSREQVIEQVIKSGMNDLVIKPFKTNDLFKAIEGQIY